MTSDRTVATIYRGVPNHISGDPMLPKPDVGQRVRVEGRDGDFIVKAVSADGGIVDLVSEADPSVEVTGVACLSLMLPEVEFPD